MAFKKGRQKRRSDRLMFMIPLRAEGLTKSGEPFECSGHAVDVNRYGAHIRLDRPASLTHKIQLTNLENNLRGEFRIVRMLESPTSEETDFGVEAVGNYPTFWGIEFPAQPRKPGESRGLLECLQCHSASLHPLSLDEIEALESGNTVKKPCSSCRSKTEWQFAMAGAKPGSPLAAPESPVLGAGGVPYSQRRPFEIFMQRPVSIRTASGEVETVHTEDLSRNEIRCTSGKNYEVNQAVTLEWENSGTGQRLQVQGRVRRRQAVAGSPRLVYCIRYEGSPVTLPPLPIKPARALYVAMAGMVAAASILASVTARWLTFTLEFPSSGAAYRVACLGFVLLLVSVAYKIWKAILAREPESRKPLRKRHRIAAALAGVFFLSSLAAGAISGVVAGRERQQEQLLLQHLAMARIFERNIDAAENRIMPTPADFQDACATLGLLAGQWQNQLDALNAAAGQVFRFTLWKKAKFQNAMTGLGKILTLDRHKLRLVKEQVALETTSKSIDPNEQQAFWQSQFLPLRQKILELDAQKNRVVKALAAER